MYKSEPGQLLNIEQILAGQVLMSKSEPGQLLNIEQILAGHIEKVKVKL